MDAVLVALQRFHEAINTPHPELRWLYTAFRLGSWAGCGLLFISLFRLWRVVPRQGWFLVVMLPAFTLFAYYTDQIFFADRTLRPTLILMIFNGSLTVFFAGLARLCTLFLPNVRKVVTLNGLHSTAGRHPPRKDPS